MNLDNSDPDGRQGAHRRHRRLLGRQQGRRRSTRTASRSSPPPARTPGGRATPSRTTTTPPIRPVAGASRRARTSSRRHARPPDSRPPRCAVRRAGLVRPGPRPVVRGHDVLADRPGDGQVPDLGRGAGHVRARQASPATTGRRTPASGAACYWDGTSQGHHESAARAGALLTRRTATGRTATTATSVPSIRSRRRATRPGRATSPATARSTTATSRRPGLLITIWSQDPPPGLRQRDRRRARWRRSRSSRCSLSAINIGIAPEPGPDSIGLVGMPVWMWAKDPNDHTVGPITASASAGGITITATAKVLAHHLGHGRRHRGRLRYGGHAVQAGVRAEGLPRLRPHLQEVERAPDRMTPTPSPRPRAGSSPGRARARPGRSASTASTARPRSGSARRRCS